MLGMAEEGLEGGDAVIANRGEALEIYVSLGDREMIGRSFTELTDAFFFAGRLEETAETARRGLAYLKSDVSADRGRLLATLGLAKGAAGSHELAYEALKVGLTIASHLSDPKLKARGLGAAPPLN